MIFNKRLILRHQKWKKSKNDIWEKQIGPMYYRNLILIWIEIIFYDQKHQQKVILQQTKNMLIINSLELIWAKQDCGLCQIRFFNSRLILFAKYQRILIFGFNNIISSKISTADIDISNKKYEDDGIGSLPMKSCGGNSRKLDLGNNLII